MSYSLPLTVIFLNDTFTMSNGWYVGQNSGLYLSADESFAGVKPQVTGTQQGLPALTSAPVIAGVPASLVSWVKGS